MSDPAKLIVNPAMLLDYATGAPVDATHPLPVALTAGATIDIGDVQVIAGGAVGEVQASPTAFTLLARLKDLLTGIVLAAGSAIIGKVDHTTTGIADGHKEVTTAGTRVALAASTAAKWVTIQAYRSNTGTIAVGGATVNASVTAGTGTGVSLAAGESTTLAVDNLNDVNIDSTVNGEGVRFVYGT